MTFIVTRYRGAISGAINASAANTELSKEEMTMTIGGLCLVRYGVLSISYFALLRLGAGGVALAQTEQVGSGNWWIRLRMAPGKTESLRSLRIRRKSTSLPRSPTRTGDVHRVVLDVLTEHKELQVVPVPSQADFAILVRASAATDSGDRPPNLSLALDASTVVEVDVLVLVPGSKRSNGVVHPRVVWESYVSNAQVEAQSATRTTVDGFLWELSNLKDKSTARTK